MGAYKHTLQTPEARIIPKEQYVSLMFAAFTEIIKVCGGPDETGNSIVKKVEYLTKVIINLIPSKETRAELKARRTVVIDGLKERYRKKELTNVEFNDALLDINTDFVGEVMGICDSFIGIVERQEVLPMLTEAELKILEDKYANDRT